MKVNIKHVATMSGLYDVYNSVAKAQHGVCTIRQLPWDYEERIGVLKKELNAIISDSYPGFLKKAKDKLLS